MRFPTFFAVCVITNIGIKGLILVATNFTTSDERIDLIDG